MLEKINFPKDIKGLSVDELNELSEDIRQRIIEVVARQGGHLASSLGAVELTVVLHYLLNIPEDHMIFDVGHQTYAHKILTGRKESIINLRQYKGVSGFPSPDESPYDHFITGHASTSVSYAQGLAEAKKISGDKSSTVAIIGDGSLSGGLCFEALNNCGHSQSELLVIYNHNEMSISPSVGALSNYLTKIVSAPVYNRIMNEVENFMDSSKLMQKLSHSAHRFEEALKGLLVPGIFFEELGFRYFGPIDGHDVENLISTVKNILPLKGPKLLHVITKKGNGYEPAEKNPERFHGTGPFKIESGEPASTSSSTSYGQTMAEFLCQQAENNDKIVAITAAMPKGTCLSLFAEKFPDRFFDVGIAEGHAIAFAAGLAKKNMLPVVSIYSTFLQRSYDQLIHDIALQKLPIVLLLDRAGNVGEDGPTHHGVFDITYMRSIPNMTVLAPSEESELVEMMKWAINSGKPVSIRYPKGSVHKYQPELQVPVFKSGKSRIMNKGENVVIFALGVMLEKALKALPLLNEQDINPTIIDPRYIKPLDEETILEVADTHSVFITIEDGNLPGGFGSAVMECLEKHNKLNKVKILRMGYPDKFITFASREQLFKLYDLDHESIAKRIVAFKENPAPLFS